MKYRQLGNLRVSEIGFGAWAIGGPVDLFGMPVGWTSVDDNESLRALRRAYDMGVNFFDTADVYGNGHSEELIGKCDALRDAVVATKVGNSQSDTAGIKDFSIQHIRRSIEKS